MAVLFLGFAKISSRLIRSKISSRLIRLKIGKRLITFSFYKNLHSNTRGQFAIEAVLLLTVLVGVFMLATNKLRERQVVQNLVKRSVTAVAKMSEQGTWREECVGIGGKSKQSAAKCHPNSIHRSLSSAPE